MGQQVTPALLLLPCHGSPRPSFGGPLRAPITEHSFAPQGGRFKKEIVVDGQSYLLLIRDEGGPPELQVGDLSSLGSLPTTLVRGWPGLWLPLLAAPGRAVRLSVRALILPLSPVCCLGGCSGVCVQPGG